MFEHASELEGFLVVSREEGAQLGTVSAIYIDAELRRLAGFACRTRRIGGEQCFVPISAVQVIGRDVVLINSESAREPANQVRPTLRNLKELQGTWVTTFDGQHLGHLVDLDVASGSWQITDLVLTDGSRLKVAPEEIKLQDEVLVPASCASQVKVAHPAVEPRSGLFGRIFGRDVIDDTKRAIKRALGPRRGSSERH